MSYITVNANKEQWERGLALAESRPVFRGSHRGALGNHVGALGEVIAFDFIRQFVPVVNEDKKTHDFRLPNGQTVEVKTKDRTVFPQESHDCTLPLYNHDHQQADWFVFVSLQRDRNMADDDIYRFRRAHIVGVTNEELMAKYGRKWNTGDTDPDNGTTFWTACYNIPIMDTYTPMDVAKMWSRNGQYRGELVG